jgi:hypothetical protein
MRHSHENPLATFALASPSNAEEGFAEEFTCPTERPILGLSPWSSTSLATWMFPWETAVVMRQRWWRVLTSCVSRAEVPKCLRCGTRALPTYCLGPGLGSLTLHHAFVAIDATTGQAQAASNAVPLKIIP